MKKSIYQVLAAGLLLLFTAQQSCKKEVSCENCIGGNQPPVANAGPDQVIYFPADSALLNGAASADPDGTISHWSWTKISGAASLNMLSPSMAQNRVKSLDTGVYRFSLRVTDNGGLSAADTVEIKVMPPTTQPNRPPVANAGADQVITLPVNSVTLDGTSSSDPDNNITGYSWIKISGPASYSISNPGNVQTPVTNLVQGEYFFELNVTDAGGLFDKDTVVINVLPPVLTGTNVYIAGWGKNAGGKTVARLWHNGAVQDLSNGQYDAWAGSVFVSGTNIYVAGYEKNASGKTVAKLWKNGLAQNLSNGQYDAEARSVFVSGADVYVAGWENVTTNVDQARLWKNGTSYNLVGNGQVTAVASSVFVSGTDVYVAGNVNDTAVIWKNQLATQLSRVVGSEWDAAHSVSVSGNDVYAAGGNYYCCPGQTPSLWKNGVVQNLQPTGNGDGETFSVFVSGPDVYVTGWSSGNGATLWKNGVLQSLQPWGSGNTMGYAVFVSGTDVYVAGQWLDYATGGEALLWKNGTVFRIPGLNAANSVFVQ